MRLAMPGGCAAYDLSGKFGEGAFEDLGLPETTRLWAEPGRNLVAAGTSAVGRVQLRRGDALYVHDGVYGGLSDDRRLQRYHHQRLSATLGRRQVSVRAVCSFGARSGAVWNVHALSISATITPRSAQCRFSTSSASVGSR